MELNNINDLLKEVNEPTLDSIIDTYYPYSHYSSYSFGCHNTGYLDDDDSYEHLCKKIYSTWYNTITNLGTTDLGLLNIKNALLNNSKYNPQSIKDGDFKENLCALYDDKNIGNDYAPVWKQGSSFLHVFCGRFYKGQSQPKIEGRLYLNLKLENIVPFVDKFIGVSKKEGLAPYFKFASNDKRPDTFLIYTDFKTMPKYIEIIEKIKSENPKLLEETELVSPNFATFKKYPYIGFGTEPNETFHLQRYKTDLEEAKRTGSQNLPDRKKYRYSYNSLREEAVSEIIKQMQEKNKKLFKIDLDKQYFLQSQKLTFKDCIGIIARKYYANQIKNLDKNDLDKVIDKITETTLNTIFTDGQYIKDYPKSEKIHVRNSSKTPIEFNFDTKLILEKLVNTDARKIKTITGNPKYNYCQLKQYILCPEGKNSLNTDELIKTSFYGVCTDLYDEIKNPDNNPKFKDSCEKLLNTLTKESKDGTNTTIKNAVYSFVYMLNNPMIGQSQELHFGDFKMRENIALLIANKFYPNSFTKMKEDTYKKYDLSLEHFCANESDFEKAKIQSEQITK